MRKVDISPVTLLLVMHLLVVGGCDSIFSFPSPADLELLFNVGEQGQAIISAEAPVEAPAEEAAEAPVEAEASDAPAEAAEPEVEVFYTFIWAGNRQGGNRNQRRGGGQGGQRRNDRDNAQGGPRGKGGKPKGKGGPRRDGGAKKFEARPPKKEKAIDPDNPFAAALMGLKNKE